MTRSHGLALAVFSLSLVLVAGCGDDSAASSDASVTFADSGTPDARPPIDAPPCTGTVCDGLCVDTSEDPLNCGGCGMECDSPGQVCTGSLPCTCPPMFLPATVDPVAFDQVVEQAGFLIGVGPLVDGTKFNVFAVVYEEDTPTGVEFDLSESVAQLSAPAVAAGYDVDTGSFMAHTPYAANEGTLIITSRCATGVHGTVTDAHFIEVQGTTDPTPVPDGCEFSIDSVSFTIGEACTPALDGGVPNDAATP